MDRSTKNKMLGLMSKVADFMTLIEDAYMLHDALIRNGTIAVIGRDEENTQILNGDFFKLFLINIYGGKYDGYIRYYANEIGGSIDVVRYKHEYINEFNGFVFNEPDGFAFSEVNYGKFMVDYYRKCVNVSGGEPDANLYLIIRLVKECTILILAELSTALSEQFLGLTTRKNPTVLEHIGSDGFPNEPVTKYDFYTHRHTNEHGVENMTIGILVRNNLHFLLGDFFDIALVECEDITDSDDGVVSVFVEHNDMDSDGITSYVFTPK